MWLKGIDEVPSVYFTKRERQEALQAQAIADAQNRPIRKLPQGFSYAWENLKKGKPYDRSMEGKVPNQHKIKYDYDILIQIADEFKTTLQSVRTLMRGKTTRAKEIQERYNQLIIEKQYVDSSNGN